MSEMALVATHLIVIGRGRLIADTSMEAFVDRAASNFVRVRTPQPDRLRHLARDHDWDVAGRGDTLELTGIRAAQVGELAAEHGVVLHELSEQRASLEEAFMKLTADAVEYHGTSKAVPSADTSQEPR